MGWYVDGNALYEQTAEWEAAALEQVEKLNSKPLKEMSADEITEWRKWSCILKERAAFKNDVAEAMAADVVEVKHGKWINAKPMSGRVGKVCSACGNEAYWDSDHTCRMLGGASPRLAKDFCSQGERKERSEDVGKPDTDDNR